MARQRGSTVPPTLAIVAADAVGLMLTAGPGAVGWASVVIYLHFLWSSPYLWLCALACPLVLLTFFLFTLWALRLCCPRLQAGKFVPGKSRGAVAWFCHLALSRAAAAAGIKDFIHSFYLAKYLYWRALGAHISYRVNTAQSIIMVDLPLVSIGPGCTISEGSHISCHTFIGERLVIRPVNIGTNVFIGKDCIVGGGTTIGDGSWIGLLNRLMGDDLPAGSTLRNSEWEHGNPQRAKSTAVQESDSESSPADPAPQAIDAR